MPPLPPPPESIGTNQTEHLIFQFDIETLTSFTLRCRLPSTLARPPGFGFSTNVMALGEWRMEFCNKLHINLDRFRWMRQDHIRAQLFFIPQNRENVVKIKHIDIAFISNGTTKEGKDVNRAGAAAGKRRCRSKVVIKIGDSKNGKRGRMGRRGVEGEILQLSGTILAASGGDGDGGPKLISNRSKSLWKCNWSQFLYGLT